MEGTSEPGNLRSRVQAVRYTDWDFSLYRTLRVSKRAPHAVTFVIS